MRLVGNGTTQRGEIIQVAPEILVSLMSLAGTLIGSVVGILTANRLTNYRIEELEKKVDKHNSVVERVAILEQNEDTQWKRIDELKTDMESVKKEVYSKGGA
jgi:predicted acylesterase/phospholipase RssA